MLGFALTILSELAETYHAMGKEAEIDALEREANLIRARMPQEIDSLDPLDSPAPGLIELSDDPTGEAEPW